PSGRSSGSGLTDVGASRPARIRASGPARARAQVVELRLRVARPAAGRGCGHSGVRGSSRTEERGRTIRRASDTDIVLAIAATGVSASVAVAQRHAAPLWGPAITAWHLPTAGPNRIQLVDKHVGVGNYV